ncbi:hypothetical protein HMI54_013524 [Coelomomyces lativittatus]|nr:hypothetical protein HMI54_013524 [Coelomomyces lativittatus]
MESNRIDSNPLNPSSMDSWILFFSLFEESKEMNDIPYYLTNPCRNPSHPSKSRKWILDLITMPCLFYFILFYEWDVKNTIHIPLPFSQTSPKIRSCIQIFYTTLYGFFFFFLFFDPFFSISFVFQSFNPMKYN